MLWAFFNSDLILQTFYENPKNVWKLPKFSFIDGIGLKFGTNDILKCFEFLVACKKSSKKFANFPIFRPMPSALVHSRYLSFSPRFADVHCSNRIDGEVIEFICETRKWIWHTVGLFIKQPHLLSQIFLINSSFINRYFHSFTFLHLPRRSPSRCPFSELNFLIAVLINTWLMSNVFV